MPLDCKRAANQEWCWNTCVTRALDKALLGTRVLRAFVPSREASLSTRCCACKWAGTGVACLHGAFTNLFVPWRSLETVIGRTMRLCSATCPRMSWSQEVGSYYTTCKLRGLSTTTIVQGTVYAMKGTR